jgi:hypothetical protein
MKKMLIPALVVCAFLCVSQISCGPGEPQYVKKFRVVVDDRMYCDPDGDNCALVGDHHQFSGDEILPPAQRQLLNTFYKDAASDNTRRFFENENWQVIFPANTLNSSIYSKIANANYATVINSCDSSIMNIIFGFQRNDLKNVPCAAK